MFERIRLTTLPTMVQTLGIFFGRGGWSERRRIDAEDDAHLLLVDFYPLDQGSNDLAAREPIGLMQASLHP